MAKGGLQSRQSPVKAVVDFYNGLYDTKHFSVCLVVWLCGIPIALQNFQNCYDGHAHPFSTFFKSVYVSLPISTIILPGALELLWLPREQHEQWANACKKGFVSGMWNMCVCDSCVGVCACARREPTHVSLTHSFAHSHMRAPAHLHTHTHMYARTVYPLPSSSITCTGQTVGRFEVRTRTDGSTSVISCSSLPRMSSGSTSATG